jgi:small subunit ribosomal protein S11
MSRRLQTLSRTIQSVQSRSFGYTSKRNAQDKDFDAILNTLTNPNPHFKPSSSASKSTPTSTNTSAFNQSRPITAQKQPEDALEPYHLHCYSHRHNTHLTLTRPNREPLISMSTGNLGFKKGKRGDYESAFQLSAYFLRLMNEKGFFLDNSNKKINSLEVILRGFSDGRKAFLAALMGIEGSKIRKVVTYVSDSTRIKIGGTRSPNPRRL